MNFRESLFTALSQETPLQIVGTINAYTAIMAQKCGFKAVYLSGAGIANYSFGIPDIGITTLAQVNEDVSRIAQATSLPILVDIDTGFDDITTTIRTLKKSGASGVHLEDQISQKKCGHLDNKKIISCDEMCFKIKKAKEEASDDQFVIMARSDSYAIEGIDGMKKRLQEYVKAGANMAFPEALNSLENFKEVSEAIQVPILANLTEFGKTPHFSLKELHENGVSIVLYPLSAARSMNKAALNTYETIRKEGSCSKILHTMQTRKELYEFLNYNG